MMKVAIKVTIISIGFTQFCSFNLDYLEPTGHMGLRMFTLNQAMGANSPVASAPGAQKIDADQNSGPKVINQTNTSSETSSKVSDDPKPSIGASITERPSILLISRAVGEVGERIVTSREVRINDAIEQALSKKPSTADGFRVLSGAEKNFSHEVSKALDEWIVFFEAKAMTNQSVSKTEMAEAIKAVHDFWNAKPGWNEIEPAADEIREAIERKLAAKKFEKLKSDPNLAPVSDDEALAYYRKNRLRFGSLPFSSFKENIKTFLNKNQTDKRLAEWREVLRRKYKVRNFISG